MNMWYYIKKWRNRATKKVNVIKKTKTHSRKKRDNTRLTANQVIQIRLIWSKKKNPIPNVCSLDKLAIYCNNKLNINKSRSVYHRIVHNLGAYSFIEDTKNFKLED